MHRRIQWRKTRIDDGAFESAGILDVDNDGVLDIVCGGYWYQGPHWTKHKLCDLQPQGEYFDDFSTIAMDVDGDGFEDIITGGWFKGELVWRKNPKGKPIPWQTHLIDAMGNIETTRAWDVDGDGELEIVPNTPGQTLRFYKLVRDAQGRGTGRFEKIMVDPEGTPTGHGLGFGWITGVNKGCLITRHGWWEPTGHPLREPWTFHREFDLGVASVPILVVDVDGDGVKELVVGSAHNYGLHYYRPHPRKDGTRTWSQHAIDPYFSQYHEMQWVDLDGDGQCELVTGNRYRAHNGRDPGETDIAGLYMFKWTGEGFTKIVIDHGTVPGASGTGIFMSIADIDGDGRLDIVAPGKEGLYLFQNLGPETVGAKK